MVDVPLWGRTGGFCAGVSRVGGSALAEPGGTLAALGDVCGVHNIDSEMRNLLCASWEPRSSFDPPKGACLYLSGSFAGGGAAGQSTPSRYSTDIIHPVLYPSCMIQTQKSLLKNLVIIFLIDFVFSLVFYR